VKINFSNVETRDFKPLPAGWYTVHVTDGEVRESGPSSKNPGSEYWHMEYTVDEGQEGANHKIWDNVSLLPHALFSLKGLCGAAGFDVSGDLDIEIEDLLGKQLQVRINQYKGDNGETYNNVKSYKPVGAAVSDANSLLPS
jgi:hypothetical protein